MKHSTTVMACAAGTAILLLFAMLRSSQPSRDVVEADETVNGVNTEYEVLPLAATHSATLAAIESEGRRSPRHSTIQEYPPRPLGDGIELVGGSERTCVTVPTEEGTIVRSGEFVIGGRFSELTHGRPVKVWWKPLNSTMDMVLLVRGRLLGDSTDVMRFTADHVTAPLETGTLEPYVDEAFFPTGTAFPAPGRWAVVATTRRNWGCFVFDVA